jgi:hypothetical protein
MGGRGNVDIWGRACMDLESEDVGRRGGSCASVSASGNGSGEIIGVIIGVIRGLCCASNG